MFLNKTIEDIDLKNGKPDCKGRVYRAKVSQFVNDNKTIGVRKALTLLKRESCPGCDICGYMDDALADYISDDSSTDHLTDIEHGRKYKLRVEWYPGSYEYPAEGDLEIYFEEIKTSSDQGKRKKMVNQPISVNEKKE